MKAALVFSFALTHSSFAQSMSWEIEAEMTSWPDEWRDRLEDKPFFGITTIPGSSINGRGAEQLSYSNEDLSFSLSIGFDGSTYHAEDDPSSSYPVIQFMDGELTGINFAFFLDPGTYDEGALLHFYPDRTISYSPDGVSEYEGFYQIRSVTIPEPSSFILALTSTILIPTRKRS